MIIKLFLLLFISCSSLYASEKINIIAIEIDGLHQKDLKGKYDILLSQEDSIELKIYPPNRAFKVFEKCNDCCISPANKNLEFYNFNENYITGPTMNVAAIYIWSPPRNTEVSNLDNLKGKKVGGRLGMPYTTKINNAIKNKSFFFKRDPTLIGLVLKVLDKDFDYIIAYTPDICDTFQKLNIPPLAYDEKTPLAVHPDKIVCKKSKKTIAMINLLKKKIKRPKKLSIGCPK